MKFWEGELSKETGGVGSNVETMDFSDLIGSTIKDIGFHPQAREKNFTLDYVKNGEDRRVVFGFNELGLWRIWEGSRNPTPQNLLMDRIAEFVRSDGWFTVNKLVSNPLKKEFLLQDGKKVLFKLSLQDVKNLPDKIRAIFSSDDDDKTRLENLVRSLEMYRFD